MAATRRRASPATLAAALVVASAAPGQAQDGAAVWQRQCSECHAAAARVLRKVPPGSVEDRADWLSQFLAGHHAPDPAARAAVVAWLLGR